MNEKRKASRARREAMLEKEGKNIVAWIIGVLILLGAIYAIWTATL